MNPPRAARAWHRDILISTLDHVKTLLSQQRLSRFERQSLLAVGDQTHATRVSIEACKAIKNDNILEFAVTKPVSNAEINRELQRGLPPTGLSPTATGGRRHDRIPVGPRAHATPGILARSSHGSHPSDPLGQRDVTVAGSRRPCQRIPHTSWIILMRVPKILTTSFPEILATCR